MGIMWPGLHVRGTQQLFLGLHCSCLFPNEQFGACIQLAVVQLSGQVRMRLHAAHPEDAPTPLLCVVRPERQASAHHVHGARPLCWHACTPAPGLPVLCSAHTPWCCACLCCSWLWAHSRCRLLTRGHGASACLVTASHHIHILTDALHEAHVGSVQAPPSLQPLRASGGSERALASELLQATAEQSNGAVNGMVRR